MVRSVGFSVPESVGSLSVLRVIRAVRPSVASGAILQRFLNVSIPMLRRARMLQRRNTDQ
jgi:hypothetical protein